MKGTLKLKFLSDGTVKVDASGLSGQEQELIDKIKSLAKAVGGSEDALTIEKHEPHMHEGIETHEHSHDS